MSPEAVFGPPNVSTSEEVERLKQENLQLLNTNVMLKEEIVSLTKENTFLAQECRVATEKFNLLQTLVVGGNLVCPQNSVQTPAHRNCQAVHGGNALQPTMFSPGASQAAQGGHSQHTKMFTPAASQFAQGGNAHQTSIFSPGATQIAQGGNPQQNSNVQYAAFGNIW